MTEIKYQKRLEGAYIDWLIATLREDELGVKYGPVGLPLEESRIKPTPLPLYGRVPELLRPDGSAPVEDDAKNAILVYKYLGPMTAEQAADRRLWSYLTHTDFRLYTYRRWGEPKTLNVVRNRWFMRQGRQGLLGNAMARLWWGTHLTHAPWERDSYLESLGKEGLDEFTYTRWLYKNQNIFQGVVARRFGSSLRLRIAFLEAMRRRASDFANLSDLSEQVERRINLVCSYRELAELPFETLMSILEGMVGKVMATLSKTANAKNGS
jgi:hypothetical protein